MGDHKLIPQLWDGNTNLAEPPQMRRPNLPSTANSVSSSNTQNLQDSRQSLDLSESFGSSISTDDDILSKSSLSVDAKEWFPPNYNRSSTPESSCGSNTKTVQTRLQKYKAQPEIHPPENHTGFSMSSYNTGFDETSRDLSKLQDIIYTLIEDPGQFDELLGTFIETLGPYYEDVNVVSNTAELIFQQALLEPNFRYNAARLCSTIEEQCPLFRSALHLLCEKKIKENSSDCRLTLFLAELYAQLNYDNLYGRFIIQTLKCVLSLGDGNNVKSVCQALKLTGSSLELYDKITIDEIFKQLEIIKQTSLPNGVINLVNSVLTLRASNWGQSQCSPTVTNNRYESQESPVTHDEPIFYGPDGKELTDEERQFLADNCSYQSDYITDDSDSLWDPDPEMDEEMQAAFRQFIQLGK